MQTLLKFTVLSLFLIALWGSACAGEEGPIVPSSDSDSDSDTDTDSDSDSDSDTDTDSDTDSVVKTVFVGMVPTDFCTLTAGWNLLSPPGYIGVNKTDLVVFSDGYYTWSQAVADTIVSDFVFGWSGSSYIFADVLIPTKGYWMYAFAVCELKVMP